MSTKIQPSLVVRNAQPADLSGVPVLTIDEFRRRVIDSIELGDRLSALFAAPVAGATPAEGMDISPMRDTRVAGVSPAQWHGHLAHASQGRLAPASNAGISAGDWDRSNQPLRLYAVLAHDDEGVLSVCSCPVEAEYPALTPDCPQAHWFEREIAEQWSIRPAGHPWLKPIRFQSPRRGGPSAAGASLAGVPPAPGVTDFFQVQGQEIHEVGVGPVHAGIIEPGHFRFQCCGEKVLHLEISLGYQHRGVERALVGGPGPRTIHYMETLAGDTTIGHATAYCQAIEALAGVKASARGQVLRAVALELERLANHIGDLGALAGDVGFLPTASYCGRIRGDALNLTATLCGSRFGRGLVRIGGAGIDVDPPMVEDLLSRLDALSRDAEVAISLLWDSPSVTARFEDTGAIPNILAASLGLVGPAARASGLEQDVRKDMPTGIYCFSHIPAATWDSGDVFARSYVRWLEIQRSIAFVKEQLSALPAANGAGQPPYAGGNLPPLAPGRIAVSLVEGWRGEICHVALSGPDGNLAHYKIVDPSFHNWFGLAMAMRDQQISDFPICNKSFNLSYCGHDL